MKPTNTTSLYILYVPPQRIILKGKEQKNDISNPHSYRVGINFANISAGNLYPETVLYIKKLRLKQKDVASHLYCVNQLY